MKLVDIIGQPLTAPKRNCRFIASYDSFLGSESLILRINFAVKVPPSGYLQNVVNNAIAAI